MTVQSHSSKGAEIPNQRRQRRPKRLRAAPRNDLSVERILQWADAFYAKYRRWPCEDDGKVEGTLTEQWGALSMALRTGARGLPGGSTLAQLLAEQRGARNSGRLPDLSVKQILGWADAFRARTGYWPNRDAGAIPEGPAGETWHTVASALHAGRRRLKKSSLARLLQEKRGVRNVHALPPLSEKQILRWADAHFAATGQWPSRDRSIAQPEGETWTAIDIALRAGVRGLRGGSSLARLLAAQRQVPNRQDLPPLTERQILAWADDFHERTGAWPVARVERVGDEAGDCTWSSIDLALRRGVRGLPGGSSLARLLERRRGVLRRLPHTEALTETQVLQWADAYHRKQGRWPRAEDGYIAGAPQETWRSVHLALKLGRRGLEGGRTLTEFLMAHGRGPFRQSGNPLSVDLILAWADAHHRRMQQWPTRNSGQVADAPRETWAAIDDALSRGGRNLPGGSTLGRLLFEKRGVRRHIHAPKLTLKQIQAWVTAFHRRTNHWPTRNSGPIPEAPGETWCGINMAMRNGRRGLPSSVGLSRVVRLLKRRQGSAQ